MPPRSHIFTHAHTHAYTHAHAFTRAHTRAHQTHTPACTRIFKRSRTHTHAHARTHACCTVVNVATHTPFRRTGLKGKRKVEVEKPAQEGGELLRVRPFSVFMEPVESKPWEQTN